MKTIADSVRDILGKSPYLAEALSQGIINYSALARQLKPNLEGEHLKHFSEGAVVMALKRLEKTTASARSASHASKTVRNITVKSNLVEYAFENSVHLLKVQEKLLCLAQKDEDVFVNFARGVRETAIIVSAPLEKTLQEMTKDEVCLERFHKLSSISIRFLPETAHIPGVYYPFFQVLAWHGINFIEIISGFSELTFIFSHKEVDRAFSVIQGVTEQ